jgi:hypothetical protein
VRMLGLILRIWFGYSSWGHIIRGVGGKVQFFLVNRPQKGQGGTNPQGTSFPPRQPKSPREDFSLQATPRKDSPAHYPDEAFLRQKKG